MKQIHRELNTAIIKFIPIVIFSVVFLMTLSPLLSAFLTLVLTIITFALSFIFWLIMKGTGIY